MRVATEETTTLTLTLTPHEAQRILDDFDKSKEPSTPGKALYTALITAARNRPTSHATTDATPPTSSPPPPPPSP